MPLPASPYETAVWSFVKDERLYITMAAVMAAIILGWEWLCNKKVDSMIEFSTFSAVIIESILVFVVSRLPGNVLCKNIYVSK